MSEELQGAIRVLQRKLAEQEKTVANTKRLINQLSVEAGMQPLYLEAELHEGSGGRAIHGDRFYGQPLSTAVRELLEMRKAGGSGPASVNEIYDALIQGGYQFEAKDEDNSKRGLRISLTKNSVTFHRLPNGKYGLLTWYPNVKQPKVGEAKNGGETSVSDETETPPESGASPQSVSFFITKAQRATLREQGYTDEQIAKMKPADAHKILGITSEK